MKTKHCHQCGASRNYIERTETGLFRCELCGNKWGSIGPIVRRLLELDEERKRVESQIQSEDREKLKRDGIKYYQPRDEG